MRRKFVIAMAMAFILAFSLIATVAATQRLIAHDEHTSVIREVLISPLDDEPFIAEFDPETRMILFFEVDGRPAGYRENQSEEDFWIMVAANIETRSLAEQGVTIHRNTMILDHEALTITEYDAYGNQTVHYLTEEEFSDLRLWRANRYGIAHDEHTAVIREVLISPLDDEPFIAEFDPETRMILFFEMDGRPAGYRENQSEEDFWIMVAANIETRGLVEQFMQGVIIHRNTMIFDHEALTITEYDAYGNQTVHYLTEEEFSEMAIPLTEL